MAEVEYNSYLQSYEWARKRAEVIARANYSCERCGEVRPLEVHHKHYATLGEERPDDLEVLCKPCHKIADEERARRTRDHIYNRRLNGWATKRFGENWAEDYDPEEIAERFDRWLAEKDLW